MKRTAALLPIAALALTGCMLLNILALPFKLLFEVLGAIGSGVGSAVDAVAVVEPRERLPGSPADGRDGSDDESDDGVLPTVRVLEEGRVLVEAPSRPRPFRLRFSAPGYDDRVMDWPEDFVGREQGATDALAAAGDAAPIRIRLVESGARSR